MSEKYKQIDEDIIRLALTFMPDSQSYQEILAEGRKIKDAGFEPLYFLDTEEQTVFVFSDQELSSIANEFLEKTIH